MVTVLVTICLSKIACYTELSLANGLHMTKTIAYNDMVEWYGATKNHTFKKITTGSDTSIQKYKVPNFRVPKFVGDTLNGDIF